MAPTPTFLFVNGTLCPADAPVIRADDAGFLHAWGAFETLRLTHGRVVGRQRHRARLEGTLARLGIDADVTAIIEQAERLAQVNQIGSEGRARVTVTGGTEGRPTTVVQAGALPASVAARRAGVDCTRADVPRAFADLKTVAWLGPRLALRDARPGDEPLRCAGDLVLEGATSNVFCAAPDGVVTPPADGRILPGTARAVLIEVLTRLGVPCRIRPLTFDTLARHGGVVTNALLPIAPIRTVDGRATPAVPWLAAARGVFDEVAG